MMRKPIAALAIFILALFAAAGRAAADTTSYAISGTYGAGSSTALSNPGDVFLFTIHNVDPTTLAGSALSAATPSNVMITYKDITAGTTQALIGMITFESSAQGGLLDIDFTFGGNNFLLLLSSLTGQQLFDFNGVSFSLPSTPPGGFDIEADLGDCSKSFLGESTTSSTSCTPIASGTVIATATAVPEPSSLLLLASGLFAMATFARRRFA